MHRRIALGLAIAIGMSSLTMAPASQAAPAADTWEFSGTLSAPTRSATAVTISVSGTAEVSQEILDRVPVTITCNAPDVPQVMPHLYRPSDGTFHAITNGGLALAPIDDTLPAAISGSATGLNPSTYELVLRFRCSSGGSWQGGVSASPARTVVIASLTSASYTTHSCLTSAVAGRCTSSQPQVTKVPSGTSVTFGATITQVWSDGVTTQEPVTGVQALTRASTWSTSFSSIAATCDYATSISSDYQYRCEAGGVEFTPVTVETITSRSTYQVAAPTLTPSFATVGSTITVSGTIQQEYSDGSYWPATTSTYYSIQFRSSEAELWRTVVSSRALTTPGIYSATFTMTEPGQVRTAVSSTYSTPVNLTELTPTDTYQISAPSMSGEVAPKVTIAPTATVKLLWSDNTYKNPPEGTQAILQFAPSFASSTPASELTWRTAAEAPADTGTATFSTVPQATGFWRVTVGGAFGPAVFVRVTGSAPSTMTATMTPAPGQQPFVGATANYSIIASLTGYVGSEPAVLFVDLGSGFERVTTFNDAGSIDGTFPVRAGQTSGDVTPALEARDAAGEVLATTSTAPIYIDGIQTYEISVVAPTKSVREGQEVRITATASGLSSTGIRYAVPWSGTVQVQRKTGSGWATLGSKGKTSGDRLTLRVLAIDDAQYRVYWPQNDAESKPFTLKVMTTTGTYRFDSERLSRKSVTKGDSVQISVRIKAEYSDKKYYAPPDGTKVRLQSFSGGSWRDVKSVFVDDGWAIIRIRPSASKTFRFVGPNSIVSKSLFVTVTAPKPERLVVDWPSRYYADEGARFSVVIKTTSGSVWSGSTTMYLQYRFSKYASWQTLDTKSYPGREVSWGWGSGTYDVIYFRVTAPSLGLSDQTSYS